MSDVQLTARLAAAAIAQALCLPYTFKERIEKILEYQFRNFLKVQIISG